MLTIKNLRPGVSLLCCALFAGCAGPAKYQIGDDVAPAKSSFQLIDKRDGSQKTSKVMSTSADSCWYGVYRIGDEQIVPSRLTILSNKLDAAMGRKLQGKKVVVNRFEIFNNMQSQLNSALAGNYQNYGFLAAAISSGGCDAGFFLEKNPGNKPAIVINLDVDVDGKKIKERIVQIQPEGKDEIGGPILAQRVKRAIDAAVDTVLIFAPK